MICNLSKVRLQPSMLTTFDSKKVSSCLLALWFESEGPFSFDGKRLTDDEIKELSSSLQISIDTSKNFQGSVKKFIKHQFDSILSMIILNNFDRYNTNAFTYLKVLIGFSFAYNPLFAIEQLMMLQWSCVFFMKNLDMELPTLDSMSDILDLSDLLQIIFTSVCSDDTSEQLYHVLNTHGKIPSSISNSVLANYSLSATD